MIRPVRPLDHVCVIECDSDSKIEDPCGDNHYSVFKYSVVFALKVSQGDQ